MKFNLNTQEKICDLIMRTIRGCKRYKDYDDFYNNCDPYSTLLIVGSNKYNLFKTADKMKESNEGLYKQRRDEFEKILNEQIIELTTPNLDCVKKLEEKGILKILDTSTYKVTIKYLLDIGE